MNRSAKICVLLLAATSVGLLGWRVASGQTTGPRSPALVIPSMAGQALFTVYCATPPRRPDPFAPPERWRFSAGAANRIHRRWWTNAQGCTRVERDAGVGADLHAAGSLRPHDHDSDRKRRAVPGVDSGQVNFSSQLSALSV